MKYLLFFGVLLMPFSTDVDMGIVVSFGLPLIILYLILWGVRTTVGKEVFRINRNLRYSLAFASLSVFVVVLSSFISPNLFPSLYRAFVNVVGISVALYQIARIDISPDVILERILRMLVYSGIVLALYFILNVFVTINQYGFYLVLSERFTGGLMSLPWGATNVISAALLFPHISIYLLKIRYGLDKENLLLSIIIMAVLITMSRTGIFVHGMMFVFASIILRRSRFIVIYVIIALLLSYLFFTSEPITFKNLLNSRLDFRGLSGRLEIWQNHLKYWLGDPLIPIGYYGSLKEFNGLSSHNIFITTLLEQGILGIVVLLLFLGSSYQTVLRSHCVMAQDKISQRLILGGSMILLVSLLVEDANFTQQYIIYFWLFYAVAILFSKAQREVKLYG